MFHLLHLFNELKFPDKKANKKTYVHDEVKARHRHIEVKLINQILIEADWLACVFDTLVLIPLMTHRLKIFRPNTYFN